jgi:tRNA-dihydrouridine synthase
MVTQTVCDAVMIGRTAPSNPWIFRQIQQYCAYQAVILSEAKDLACSANARVGTAALGCPVEPSSTVMVDCHSEEPAFGDEESGRASRSPRAFGALPYDAPTELDRYQMIRTYFQMLIEEELPDAVGKMKQFASWFTHGVPGGAALRKAIYESKSAVEILERVEEFFEARLSATANA